MMENKVWDILKNQKEIYTEEGQLQIEKIRDTIARIFEKVGKDDMKVLYEGMDEVLFPTFRIIENYLKEDDKSMSINLLEPRKSCRESEFCPVKCNEYPELCPTGFALHINKTNETEIN